MADLDVEAEVPRCVDARSERVEDPGRAACEYVVAVADGQSSRLAVHDLAVLFEQNLQVIGAALGRRDVSQVPPGRGVTEIKLGPLQPGIDHRQLDVGVIEEHAERIGSRFALLVLHRKGDLTCDTGFIGGEE